MSKRKLTPFNLPIPGWNERRMTSRDFDLICEREGIEVIGEHDFATDAKGFLGWREDGAPVIFIDPKLKGGSRLRTQFHELGHFFLHSGQKHTLRSLNGDKEELSPEEEWAELEANVAALIAVAPGFLLNLMLRIMTPHAGRRNWMGRKGSRSEAP